jgi:uncharacterized protein
MTRVYLDTCIVIYYIERHSVYAGGIDALLKSAPPGDFCYSPLVRLECLVKPLRSKDLLLQQLYQRFFTPQLFLDMTPDIFDLAAQLRADHAGLKTPDALHLATAQHYGCAEFWTNDERLHKIAPHLAKNVCKP